MAKNRREKRVSLENPAIPLSSANIVTYIGGGARTLSGVDVSPESAIRLTAVWRAVQLISGTIAALPLRVYQSLGEGRREQIRPALFDDPVYPDLTWYDFVEQQMLSLLLWGNAYCLKIKNEGETRVERLLPLLPETVVVKREMPTAFNPSGKVFRIMGSDGVLTPNEVIHLYGLTLDGVHGLSPIEAARQSIGASLAAEEVAAMMFDSGLQMGGLLQAEVEIDAAQAEQAKRAWRDKVGGLVRSHEVAVLSAGWSFTPAMMPPKDAQWIEARQFGVQEIARLYGVPADLLMDNTSTGNTNVEQRGLSWIKFGLAPLLDKIADRLSLHLLPVGQFCEFFTDPILGTSLADKVAAVGILIRSGYDPAASVEAVGLAEIEHLGLLPITLQKAEAFDAEVAVLEAEAEPDPVVEEPPVEDDPGGDI